jgi:hypothetical protein
LFSTFKPLTLTPASLSRLKFLLHENTGKGTRRFLPNSSAIPKTLPSLLEKNPPRLLATAAKPNLKKSS